MEWGGVPGGTDGEGTPACWWTRRTTSWGAPARQTRTSSIASNQMGACIGPSQSSCLTAISGSCCSGEPTPRSPSPGFGPTPAVATSCMAMIPRRWAPRLM
eukprot:jgi/Botrbrau1/3973/Bobra.0365s0046.2